MKRVILTDRVRQHCAVELSGQFPVETVLTYSNEDALAAHRSKKADLIIIELYGSGMNAVEFCSRVRESAELSRVSIIVCCRDNEIELSESMRCRANAVMRMPVQPSQLHGAVQQLLAIPARTEYQATFSARCARPSLKSSFNCRGRNISITGMLVEADADLQPGDRINCSLVIPPAPSFEAQAVVVRTAFSEGSTGRYGLRFSRLDPAALRAIEAFVQKNLSWR
jgi:CheY-like chemotaxis protein